MLEMRSIRIFLVFATVFVIFLSVYPSGDQRVISPASGIEDPPAPLFLNVSSEVGLSGVRGDSFAWGDYNDDGFQDLLVKGNRLFENTGPPEYGFTEVTEEVGLVNSGYSVWGDLDNDGYLDIFSVGHPYEWSDSVWINEGPPGFRFTDVSGRSGPSGVDDGSPGLAVALGDLDRDGDLDAYVVNWRDDANIKYEDVLWENTGDATFRDITDDAGIVDWNEDRGEPNAGMGVNMGDYNNDGWLDIYVSNYLITPNYLWENQGDMTFVDVAIGKGAAGEQSRTPQETYYGHTAGSQWADYDNDGDLDMWSSNLAHKDPYRTLICANSELLQNNGVDLDYSFTNKRDQTGIPTNVLGNEELFFGIAWGDFDNDGDQDMWIPQIKNYIDYAFSFLFRNNGDGSFTDVSEEAGLRVWDSDGGAWCDYDNDGDLDLVTEGKYPYENATYETRLYQNQGVGVNSYLNVNLKGTRSEASGIGARVYAQDPDDQQFISMREVEGGTAGHSYVPSFVQEFGFGDRKGSVDLEIRWPVGTVQFINDVDLNGEIFVREPTVIDLSLDIAASQEKVTEGDHVELDIRIRNIGESDIRDCKIALTDNLDGGSEWSREINIGSIDAGDEHGLTMDLDTNDMAGVHNLQVRLVGSYPQDEDDSNDISSVEIDVGLSNDDPVLEAIHANPEYVLPGETTEISVRARDPDGDVLSYDFEADHGMFERIADQPGNVLWTAPTGDEVNSGMEVLIKVIVSDGRGGSASGDTVVIVDIPMIPPWFISLQASPESAANDGYGKVTISVNIQDNEGPDGIEIVEADISDFGGSGNEPLNDVGSDGDEVPNDGIYSMTFTVPKGTTRGTYELPVTVHDRQGLSAEDTVVFDVHDAPDSGDNSVVEGRTADNRILIIGAIIVLFLIVFVVIYLAARISRRFGRKV